MLNGFKLTLIVACACIVIACGSEKTSEPAEKSKENYVIPQAQLDALNKAKAMEHTLQENKNKRDQQIKEQGL